jgi:hypothetical protein
MNFRPGTIPWAAPQGFVIVSAGALSRARGICTVLLNHDITIFDKGLVIPARQVRLVP